MSLVAPERNRSSGKRNSRRMTGVCRFAIRRRRVGDSGVKIFRYGSATEWQDRASPAGHAAHSSVADAPSIASRNASRYQP